MLGERKKSTKIKGIKWGALARRALFHLEHRDISAKSDVNRHTNGLKINNAIYFNDQLDSGY